MSRIFRYILAADNGMAPCVDGALVTLATCKPQIRKTAQPGDWVIGFYPGRDFRGLVAWSGRVQQTLAVGRYEAQFRGRSDAVYRERADGSFKRLRPDYHAGEGQVRKDTTAPVLVFDMEATWYFGDRPHLLPDSLLHLAAAGRGHRVSGCRPEDAKALLGWLTDLLPPGIHGGPRDGRSTKPPKC